VKPLLWMRAIRDLGELPAARLAVLFCLALRMDAKGSGYAATRTLEDDAKVSRATVKRATKWARDGDWLVQVQRGHRIANGRAVASRWQLTTPTQGLTGDTLAQTQGLTRATQGLTREPQEVLTQEISPSLTPVPTGPAPAELNGGRETHEYEPNARRAITALIADRTLPFTPDALLATAYRAGNGDPWQGYLAVKVATEQSLAGARDPAAVLRKRLGVAS
jgi:hypothetical protein